MRVFELFDDDDAINEAKQRLDPKCWTGYKKQGTKMKGGVRVNNCVPAESIEEENKGLYYNVNKRKKAGISRDKDHPKAPTAQAWKDAAKTAKKTEAVNLDRSKNVNYPNDADTQKHRLDTAKRLLSDPKTDPDSRREAAAIIARMEPKGKA